MIIDLPDDILRVVCYMLDSCDDLIALRKSSMAFYNVIPIMRAKQLMLYAKLNKIAERRKEKFLCINAICGSPGNFEMYKRALGHIEIFDSGESINKHIRHIPYCFNCMRTYCPIQGIYLYNEHLTSNGDEIYSYNNNFLYTYR